LVGLQINAYLNGMVTPNAGILLIAEPFLKDPNFMRSVILLCEHQKNGSFGFVLNKNIEYDLGELIHELDGHHFPVYYGGPVQLDTIHFIHTVPDLVEGGFEVTEGIFWGGDFEQVKMLIKTGMINENQIRFFIGYAGWTDGQLEDELNEHSWFTVEATSNIVFNINANETWKNSIKELGSEYLPLINYPIDPLLN
jgi:putative transcriptional regulator